MSEKTINIQELPDSKQQPAWHVAVLGALTLFLPYVLCWSYKTWRDLKHEAMQHPEMDIAAPLSVFRNISPFWRTIGLLIPIPNIYLLAVLVLSIANLNPNPNSFIRRRPLLTCGLVVGTVLGLLILGRLPGLLFFLSLLSSIPFAFVQHWLNQYWASVEPADLPIRHAFSLGEMIAIIIGASIIGLCTAGFMIGIKPH